MFSTHASVPCKPLSPDEGDRSERGRHKIQKFLPGLFGNCDVMARTLHPLPAPAMRLGQQLQAGIQIQTRASWGAGGPAASCTLQALPPTPSQQSPGFRGPGPEEAGRPSYCWRVTVVLFGAQVGSMVLSSPGTGEPTTVKLRQCQVRSSQLGSRQCQAVSGLSFPGPGVPPSGGPRALEGAHGIQPGR